MSTPARASVTTPAGLAGALLRGPMTPLRLRKLVRLLRGHPPPYVAATLAALPDASARATVTEAVTAAGLSSE